MASSTASPQRPAAADGSTVPAAEPPPRRRYLRSDAWLLLVSVAVVVLSVVLEPAAEAVRLFGWEVPPLCVFKATLGIECWGCGLTRAFTHMGHADPAAAFARHRMGPVLYLVVVAQIPLRAWRLWQEHRRTGLGPVGGYPPS